MNEHSLKKVIKNEMDKHITMTPPVIDFKQVSSQRQKSSKPSLLILMRSLRLTFASLLMIIVTATIIILNLPNTTGPIEKPDGDIIFKNNSESLALSLVSQASLLTTYQSSNLSFAPVSLSTMVTTNYSDELVPFLGMIEILLSENSQPKVTVLVPDESALYDNHIQIETLDLLGVITNYDILYNLTAYEESDDEITYSLNGLYEIDEVFYNFTGAYEQDDESSELKLTVYLNASERIETTYEKELDESSYQFRKFDQDELILESILEIEIEDDEKELKFEIITETYAKKYALEYDFDDEPIIRIKFEFETIESNRKEVGMMRISIRYNDDESPYYDILISVGNSEFHENKDRGKSDSRGNQNPGKDTDQPGKGNQNRL